MDVGGSNLGEDDVACEEPLQIELAYDRGSHRVRKPVAVTMRTPGQDRELAAGFLFCEGVVRDRTDIASIEIAPARPAGPDHPFRAAVARVFLSQGPRIDLSRFERQSTTLSSCGLCGRALLEDLTPPLPRFHAGQETGLSATILRSLPQKLRAAQRLFNRTGGLHAAGLFSANGDLLALSEDVGRHNAMDKVIGWAFLQDRLVADGAIFLVSGRVSFELVQKAIAAGFTTLAAVGAPSSLAVRMAAHAGLTLAGFLSEQRVNVYTGILRIAEADRLAVSSLS